MKRNQFKSNQNQFKSIRINHKLTIVGQAEDFILGAKRGGHLRGGSGAIGGKFES